MPRLTTKQPAPPEPRKHLRALCLPNESAGVTVGKALASPANAAARVMHAAEHPKGLGAQIDVPDLADVLQEHARAVQAGDLSGVEAMLVSQATALQSLFVRLSERAMACDKLTPFEGNLRMALRAQNQARATLETLATIKNPPVVFARQANIANGPQQVNNGGPRADDEITQTKVLEGIEHERMDTGATGATGGSNQTLETVGAIHRAAHR